MKSNVEKEFDLFGKRVVKQARTILSKNKINATKTLYNSLKYDLKVYPSKSISFSLFSAKYWDYVDQGVRGVGGTKANGQKWILKKNTGFFKYKEKKPPTRVFSRWLTIKGKNVRDSKGRFIKRKQAMFAVATAVFHQGTKQTNFIRRPFELAFKKLPDDIVKAYGLDIEGFLNFALK